MSAPLHDLFEECLAELEAGKSLSEIMAAHPEAHQELEPLLRVAMQLSSRQSSDPRPQAVQRSRVRMLARAAELREPEKAGGFLTWLPRSAFALMAAAFVLIISGYGLFSASAQALPGDLLYPIKRSAESLRLEITANKQAREVLEEQFAELRTGEVFRLLEEGREEFVSFEGAVQQMEGSDWIVEGILVLLDDETRIIGDIRLSDVIEVEGETRAEGHVFAFELHKRLFTLLGTVDRMDSARWQINGQWMALTRESDIEDGIKVGDAVIAVIAVADDGSLTLKGVSRLEESRPDPEDDNQANAAERIEFDGQVEAIGVTLWVVDHQTLRIDSDTDIDEGINLGDRVTVKAERRAGTLWALDIGLSDDDVNEPQEPQDGESSAELDDDVDGEGDEDGAGDEDGLEDEDDQIEEDEEEEKDEDHK
ncbi:MAG: DUF5666 domain-containing protein [Anaerolineales bacterium]|nr:DUF5666 domain-containing protein [Anaerolineales bacterium]